MQYALNRCDSEDIILRKCVLAFSGFISALLINTSLLAAEVVPLLSGPVGTSAGGQEFLALTVAYGPGEASPPHRHNADVFVYVLEGQVVMQIEGEDPVTLSKGQTFSERPNDVHLVSKNASLDKPAKILVHFLKKAGAPSTVPVHD